MKIVFLYAGQGSQKVGMGKDMYEEFQEYREIVDSINLLLDFKKLMNEGPIEELSQTENTQPCMSVFAAGVTNVLKKNGIRPDAACGLSLGEYGALHAAEVFDADTYVNITAFRGRKMMEAAKGHHCSMSAILGMDAKTVEEACKASKDKGFITLANYNCPQQYVICGDEEAVLAAESYLKEAGAKRCVRLNVSGPFHTKYMEPAAEALREKLESISFHEPEIPVVLNVTGDFLKENENLKEMLEKQVKSSVHFEESLRKLMEAGADTFIEIGPGNALSGFAKKTAKALEKEVKIISIDTAKDLRNLIENKEVLING
ncbi:MAG: ACP S-malonyltransferase [Thermoflexaceae bacterium]|nr:ACP S-malonyltransferase [Thermoflexaceae bacterium]